MEREIKKVDINLDEANLEITEENWDQYFFDVRKHNPQQGQIIACYSAIAYFVDGIEKEHVIQLLKGKQKAEAVAQIMRKLHHASEPDCWRIPREMAEDLISGMSEIEVLKKEYKYTAEFYYYTEAKYVPDNDPHWTIISILNLDDFLSKSKNTNEGVGNGEGKIKSKEN